VLHAFGFTSKGWNAYKSAHSDLVRITAAGQFAELRRIGTPYGKALDYVMDQLGLDDERNAKTMIRKGKQLPQIHSPIQRAVLRE
jgi:hypothetical protein